MRRSTKTTQNAPRSLPAGKTVRLGGGGHRDGAAVPTEGEGDGGPRPAGPAGRAPTRRAPGGPTTGGGRLAARVGKKNPECNPDGEREYERDP